MAIILSLFGAFANGWVQPKTLDPTFVSETEQFSVCPAAWSLCHQLTLTFHLPGLLKLLTNKRTQQQQANSDHLCFIHTVASQSLHKHLHTLR